MKLINYITLVTCAVVLSCCSNGSASDNKAENASNNGASPVNIDTPADPKMRSQALGILDHRIKNYPDTYAVVEAGVLNYEFVHNGREISKIGAYAGSWIDFKRDFTYDYGKYDVVNGSGRYHFRTDINQLVMIDNNKAQNPQEWNVKIGGDVLILVGTTTYGNNAYQMKLQRSDNKPVKQ